MDKKDWRFGVVGNIVASHIDEDGIERYGTKAFTGGTKVYLFGRVAAMEHGNMLVIGLNRFHRYAVEAVPMNLIENVRMQRIYKPKVLDIIGYVEAVEGWHWWGRTAADRRDAEQFVKEWNEINSIERD